ncbi:TniQ family protein [Azospirillum sp. sgz302134]
MLPYFPTIYPDELLYSVVARYHRHTGANSPMLTMGELFGDRSVRLTPFLVGRLRDLARRLPPDRRLTPTRLAMTATFYPYCVAYEPPPVRQAMLDAMTERSAERRFATWDIAANPLHFSTVLRCCRFCAVEATERYGEPYWRRAHQLPGVLVCPDHGVPLTVVANAPATTAEHQHLVTAPNVADLGDIPRPAWTVDGTCLALLQEIARRSCQLLEAPPPANSAEVRLSALAELGLTDGVPMRPNLRRLCEAYVPFARPIQPVLKEVRSTGWLSSLMNPHGPPVHPLHHILFDLLLDDLSRLSLKAAPSATAGRRHITPRDDLPPNGGGLAKHAPTESAFQHRRERTWMSASLIVPVHRRFRPETLDWPVVDLDLAVRIRHAAAEMLNETPRRRVTRNAIKIRLGKMIDTDRWGDRLPETLHALSEVTETTEAFHKRLIARALANLGAAAATASILQVRKLSGVPAASVPFIQAALADIAAVLEAP